MSFFAAMDDAVKHYCIKVASGTDACGVAANLLYNRLTACATQPSIWVNIQSLDAPSGTDATSGADAWVSMQAQPDVLHARKQTRHARAERGMHR